MSKSGSVSNLGMPSMSQDHCIWLPLVTSWYARVVVSSIYAANQLVVVFLVVLISASQYRLCSHTFGRSTPKSLLSGLSLLPLHLYTIKIDGIITNPAFIFGNRVVMTCWRLQRSSFGFHFQYAQWIRWNNTSNTWRCEIQITNRLFISRRPWRSSSYCRLLCVTSIVVPGTGMARPRFLGFWFYRFYQKTKPRSISEF